MKIKCTYENCFKHFATYEAMLAHKKKDPKHHYCAQCDVDCDDDLAFFIHQLGSSNHSGFLVGSKLLADTDHLPVCCPVCAKEVECLPPMEEYKSDWGSSEVLVVEIDTLNRYVLPKALK